MYSNKVLCYPHLREGSDLCLSGACFLFLQRLTHSCHDRPSHTPDFKHSFLSPDTRQHVTPQAQVLDKSLFCLTYKNMLVTICLFSRLSYFVLFERCFYAKRLVNLVNDGTEGRGKASFYMAQTYRQPYYTTLL
jgi:hypothetical protein